MISKKPLYYILIINLLLYAVIILIYPGFIYDDFTIFSLVSHNNNILATNPNTIFFLFVRPISYMLFKLDYMIWGNNYIGMKLFTLILHILFMSIFFLLLKTITELLKKKFNYWLALLVTIVFSIHPSSLMWVYWISNRTELLGLLFYSLSILFFLKYFIEKKSIYVFLVIAFYLLSILSKQQGLHLPILFLFALFFLSHHFIKREKRILIAAYICTGLMFFYSLLNYLIYGSTLDLSQNLIKKPLSLLGDILHAAFPIASQNIYNFFLLNKRIAVILLIILLVGFILFVVYRKVSIKNISKFVLFTFIIFYPRIMAVGGIRLNGIIVFWLMIGLYLLLTKLVTKEKVLKPIVSSIIALSVFTFFIAAKSYDNNLTKYKKQVNELGRILNDNKDVSIISDQFPETIKQEIYYLKNNSFGVDTTFKVLPIFFDSELKSDLNLDEKLVDIKREKNRLEVRAIDPMVYLSYYKDKVIKEGINIIKTKPSFNGREYSFIEAILTKNSNRELIYFNGASWEKTNSIK